MSRNSLFLGLCAMTTAAAVAAVLIFADISPEALLMVGVAQLTDNQEVITGIRAFLRLIRTEPI